jgi:hypothetical protein
MTAEEDLAAVARQPADLTRTVDDMAGEINALCGFSRVLTTNSPQGPREEGLGEQKRLDQVSNSQPTRPLPSLSKARLACRKSPWS